MQYCEYTFILFFIIHFLISSNFIFLWKEHQKFKKLYWNHLLTKRNMNIPPTDELFQDQSQYANQAPVAWRKKSFHSQCYKREPVGEIIRCWNKKKRKKEKRIIPKIGKMGRIYPSMQIWITLKVEFLYL